jgi:energy-coupling factor transporter ATP-binding protein EcfA2
MLLMRSRGEAELARMMTEIEKLDKLRTLWDSSKKPNLLRCLLDDGKTLSSSSSGAKHNKIILRNLHYSRGTAMARADHIELGSGVYALTGSNGSGKSTLFRILMSCDTNEKQTELPTSINLLTPADPLTEEDDLRRATACLASLDDDDETTDCEVDGHSGRELHPRSSITMPSKHVVEISQNFYWPLYSKPIDWIFQDFYGKGDAAKTEKRLLKVAEQLHALQFFQSSPKANHEEEISVNMTLSMDGTVDSLALDATEFTTGELTIQRIMMELDQEKEDWFNDLSGGQKSKVELVRTVFLREKCPDVLLVDETMAPLDPASKELVMSKLKSFCSESIIIVIYHTDVGQGKEIEGKLVDCVRSNEFFDKNIHLEKGIVHLRDTC